MNEEQDVKWVCKDCGHVWYEDIEFYFVECKKCKSENIIEIR